MIKTPLSLFLFAMVATIACCMLFLQPTRPEVNALLAAWLLALLHGFAVYIITRHALKFTDHKFFMWGLGMNGVRVLVLLTVLFLLHRWGMEYFQTFLAATLIGYFCFLFSEVFYLHHMSMKGHIGTYV